MSHIVTTVNEHFKSIAEQFISAYNGQDFFFNKNAAEELLYMPASNAINALEPVDAMIKKQVANLLVISTNATEDCVKLCEKTGKGILMLKKLMFLLFYCKICGIIKIF